MKRILIFAVLLNLSAFSFNAYAQESALGVDLLGGFGRAFGPDEQISFNGAIRPVYDLNLPVNLGIMFSGGPTTPSEWSVLFERNIATIKFGEDTSTINLSVKTATVLKEGTELTNNWYAFTINYKPNVIKGGVWSRLSSVFEPVLRTLSGRPDYFEFRSGLRVTF